MPSSSQIHSTFLTLKEFARPRIFSTVFSLDTYSSGGGDADPALHQAAGRAAHQDFPDLPAIAFLLHFGADLQRARGMAEAHAAIGADRRDAMHDGAAIATAPVPVMSWWSTPIEKMRAKRSIEPGSTVRPSDAV